MRSISTLPVETTPVTAHASALRTMATDEPLDRFAGVLPRWIGLEGDDLTSAASQCAAEDTLPRW